METLLSQFSLTLPLWVFLVVALYLFIGTYFVFKTVLKSLNLNQNSASKQGFLNKPLLQFVAVFLMASSIIGVIYYDSVSKDTGVITEAERKVDIQIEYEVLSSNLTSSELRLRALPIIEGKEWGDPGQTFDVVWTIQSDDGSARNYVEQAVSSLNPSEIEITLANGSYKATALVSDDEGTFSETIEIDI
ncbi:hypothetical protein JW978_00150 [Candidatus Dojkabacteria bacterium]|nr:hypothetical protein [Candidatus Dojkabacteria bacterium]